MLGLVVLVIGACNRSDRTRIGVVPKAVAHVFWKSVHAGAVAAGREADIDIEWRGPPAETDFSRQIEIVDAMINARVDGIVVAPTEATALVTVVERAVREGIPVTIFDSGINTDKLPLSVQFGGLPFEEGALLAAAKWCENALGVELSPPDFS